MWSININHLLIASSSSVYGANKKLPFTEVDKTETYYGAVISLEAQVESIKTANKVFMPIGTQVSKEDAIAFTKAGGGGENPSDTATFVKDKDGNLLIQFHSDKTTTKDIQDNSTLAQEGENYKESIKSKNAKR